MSARLYACVGVLLAAEALAGWTEIPINGTPSDVQVEGEGRILVVSNTESAVKACMPGAMCMNVAPPAPLVASVSAAVSETDAGCIQGYTIAGTSGCAPFAWSMGVAPTQVQRVRRSPGGLTGMLHTQSSQNRLIWFSRPSATTWSGPLVIGTSSTRSMSALTAEGVDFITAVGVNGAQPIGFVTTGSQGFVTPTPITVVSDAQLFRRLDGGVGLIVSEASPGAGGGVLLVGPFFSDGGFASGTAQTPGGYIRSIGYTEEGGSALGAGFGIAVLVDGGLLGAVPNPAAPGSRWVVRPPVPISSPAIQQIACATPHFCAANTGAPAAPKGWVYWNDAAPDASISAVPTLEVGMPVDVTIDVSDSDGDPLWITWELDAGGFITVSPDGGSARLTPTGCGNATLYAYVSDGYAPHDMRFGTPVFTRGVPSAPVIVPSAGTQTQAGGAGLSFSASVTDAGCDPPTITWSTTGTATIDSLGQFTPPATECSPDGGTYTVTARATNGAGSSSSSIDVQVAPWGLPRQPSMSDRSQTAGFDASYPLTGMRHDCAAAPVEVVWQVDGGGPGVSWAVSDAGIDVFSTNPCTTATVTAQPHYRVGNQDGPPASMNVNILRYEAPIPNGGFSMNYGFDAGVASGRFTVSGAGCLEGRGLTADVVARDVMGVEAGRVSPPQDIVTNPVWTMPIDKACNGGTYFITATLFPTGQTDTAVTTVGRIDAGISVADTFLDVACSGVRGDVRATVPADPTICQSVSFRWEQLAGPPLRADQRVSGTISVETEDGGFDLIGETIRWRVTAIAGPGNEASAEFDVFLRHRFLKLGHSIGPPTASGDDLRTVSITVENTEPCGASAIVLEESLDGLTPIAAGVRVDGEKVDAAIAGGRLTIGPFAIAGGQRRNVTYLARAPIFAQPRPTAIARIRAEQVSIDDGVIAPVAPTCGCSSSPALLLLAALSLWPRRRAAAPRRTSARSVRRSPPS